MSPEKPKDTGPLPGEVGNRKLKIPWRPVWEWTRLDMGITGPDQIAVRRWFLHLFNERIRFDAERTYSVDWWGVMLSCLSLVSIMRIAVAWGGRSWNLSYQGPGPWSLFPRRRYWGERFLGFKRHRKYRQGNWLGGYRPYTEWAIGGAKMHFRYPRRRYPKSDIKILYRTPWLSLRQRQHYIYAHEEKSHGLAVAVLVWHEEEDRDVERHVRPYEVLGRYEVCPAHSDDHELCAITGLVEPGEKPRVCAARELEEETGYKSTPYGLVPLGTIRQSKQTDTIVYLWAYHARDKKPHVKPVGDGTIGESDAYTQWIHPEEAICCNDPLMGTMIARLKHRKLHQG